MGQTFVNREFILTISNSLLCLRCLIHVCLSFSVLGRSSGEPPETSVRLMITLFLLSSFSWITAFRHVHRSSDTPSAVYATKKSLRVHHRLDSIGFVMEGRKNAISFAADSRFLAESDKHGLPLHFKKILTFLSVGHPCGHNKT
jgi:hypothetical protein